MNRSRWQPFFGVMRNLLSSFTFCACGELCFFGVEDLQLAARNVLFRIHKSQNTVLSCLVLHEVLRGADVKVFVQTKYNEDRCQKGMFVLIYLFMLSLFMVGL
jgi:hypothetical protein